LNRDRRCRTSLAQFLKDIVFVPDTNRY
jgi:hypothetical protein